MSDPHDDLPPLPEGPDDKKLNDLTDLNDEKTVVDGAPFFPDADPAPPPVFQGDDGSAGKDKPLSSFLYPVSDDEKRDAPQPSSAINMGEPLPPPPIKRDMVPPPTIKVKRVKKRSDTQKGGLMQDRKGRTAEDIRRNRRDQMVQQEEKKKDARARKKRDRFGKKQPTKIRIAERRVADRESMMMPPVEQSQAQTRRSHAVEVGQESEQESVYTRPDTIIMRAQRSQSCIGRAIALLFGLGLLGFATIIIGITLSYILIARNLPRVSELDSRVSSFETGRIYDSGGEEIYTLTDRNAGNRTYVPIDEISPYVVDATVATEDVRFYTHPGFDPIAIGRAILGAVTSRSFTGGGGASTITQQVVRNLLLSDDEAAQKTAMRKVREIILSAELQRTEEREKILEIYLNEIYYGNRAYGIEAAAETYFNKSAKDLTLAEASLLAGLPQAPAWWDPVTAPDLAEGRQWEVLSLMTDHGKVDRASAQAALNERAAYKVDVKPIGLQYPHYTLAVLGELQQQFGTDFVYGAGFNVYTTLDTTLQAQAEQAITNNRGLVNSYGANNAALTALDPNTGAILAMVGSFDYNDESIDGQVNMNRASRQPGSIIKPLVYLSAFEQGMTPATLFWDVPTAFPNGINPPFEPENFDREFHGPVLLRNALANSYNIPPVKALEAVGLCQFVGRAQTWGINYDATGCDTVGSTTNYGLALALGGGATTPLEMANAYQMLANEGVALRPYSISRIEDRDGNVIFEHKPTPLTDEEGHASAAHTYLISHILDDDGARLGEFAADNYLNIDGQPVAAKTGTSGTSDIDVRDGWTAGYSSDLVTVVWVGNTDNTPIGQGANGHRIAAPIWNQFMRSALVSRPAVPFVRPENVVEHDICRDSGTFTSPICGTDNRRKELFDREQPPLSPNEHFIKRTDLDPWTLRIVNENCNDEPVISIQAFNLLTSSAGNGLGDRYKAEAESWLVDQGSWWARERGLTFPLPPGQQLLLNRECESGTARPQVQIFEPSLNTIIDKATTISGIATAPGFSGYQLEYGIGEKPNQFFPLNDFQTEPETDGTVAIIAPSDFPRSAEGPITLRLTVFGPDNPYTSEVGDRPKKSYSVVVRLPLKPTATPFATKTTRPTRTRPPTLSPTPVDLNSAPTLIATPGSVEGETAVPVNVDVEATIEPTFAPVAPSIEEVTEEATIESTAESENPSLIPDSGDGADS